MPLTLAVTITWSCDVHIGLTMTLAQLTSTLTMTWSCDVDNDTYIDFDDDIEDYIDFDVDVDTDTDDGDDLVL